MEITEARASMCVCQTLVLKQVSDDDPTQAWPLRELRLWIGVGNGTGQFIQPHFDYAATLWYMGSTEHLKHKLQVTQNKVVRFILNILAKMNLTW